MSEQTLSDQEFIDDLIEDPEVARILHLKPQSIPVMRCRGKLRIKSYKVGRKTLSSRREVVALLKASAKEYSA